LVVISLTDNPDETFYQDKNFPPIIRVGDINADSYPDLITVKRNFKTDQTITKVYLNVKQNPEDQKSNIRTFNSNNTYILPVNNSVYSSFFDLDENGQLDLIIVSQEKSGYKIQGFYNNYIYDAFFLKSDTLLLKDIFYSNEIGVNYRYISTNLNGSRRMDVNYQMIQLGTNYLNLPYSYIGIGRSNNYIENFHVISNSFAKGYSNYKIFTPIIPNSGLIITKKIESNPESM
jgi:integrin alpha FG-GAP repeat containing protein 1